METTPTVVSLFAGCGGSSLGYEMAGYRELLAIDFDKHACEIFRLNFKCPCWERDITKVTGKEILDKIKMKPGELDVLDGSPPCQGFSTSGKRRVNDPRNDLFRHFLRIASEVRPKAIVMENVSGLVKGKMRGIFKEMLREFDRVGYRVRVKMLNSMHYGVPQSRQRLFFVAVRKDIDIDNGEITDIWPAHTGKKIGCEAALTGCPQDGEIKKPTGKLTKLAAQTKPGERADRYHDKGHYFNVRKTHPKRPSNTVTSMFQTGAAGLLHWEGNRFLTIAEVKRLCSFPDEFKMAGSFEQKWARLGNAVMPLQMRAVALAVKENILAKLKNTSKVNQI